MRSSDRRLAAGLRPSVVGMIVFVLLIALQACLGSSSGKGGSGPGGTYEITSSRSMGWPPSVVFTHTTPEDGPPRTDWKIRWERLLPVVAVNYGLAMAAGRLAMRKRRR